MSTQASSKRFMVSLMVTSATLGIACRGWVLVGVSSLENGVYGPLEMYGVGRATRDVAVEPLPKK